MNCLLCNSVNIKKTFIYKGKDIYLEKLNITKFELEWYECLDCKVFFSKQYENIEKIYEDNNLYDASYDMVEIKKRFEKIMSLDENISDNIQRVKRIKYYHKQFLKLLNIRNKKFKVLDIGAGLGVFLTKFLDNNYEGYALELNKVAVTHLKNILPTVKLFQDYMQNINFENLFDLITLNRVLEHIKNPIEVLDSVKKSLVKNGLVYIEVPDSLSYQLDGDTNEAFSSGHYMVYNPNSIYYLFEKVGLEIMKIERIKEPSGKFTIYVLGAKK